MSWSLLTRRMTKVADVPGKTPARSTLTVWPLGTGLGAGAAALSLGDIEKRVAAGSDRVHQGMAGAVEQ